MPIQVSIVEDDNRIRESLAILIDAGPSIRCLSTHRTGEDALAQIPLNRPDVVLMDINLPNMSGIECVQKLKMLMPQLQILMLTMYEDDGNIFRSLMAGASGYLVKRTRSSEVLQAIKEVHSGTSPLSGKVARKVVEYFQKLEKSSPEKQHLSKREREILDLLVKGYRYKEIADILSIGFETVRSHLKNIYEKLHVTSRTEAVVKFLQR
jgi:DNA-binding NarL/FixJ family response regulator